jgi:hypothetical protein
MHARLPILFAGLVVAFGLMQPSFARGKGGAKTETISGCVVQGPQANEYSIKAQDGKTYDMHSTNVKLAEHMGHQVEVTGTVTSKKEKTESKNGLPEEAGQIHVTSLKMVRTSCK